MTIIDLENWKAAYLCVVEMRIGDHRGIIATLIFVLAQYDILPPKQMPV